MDYQNRVGSKFGGGGAASHSVTNADRRERLRKLAAEHINPETDPYCFRNHLGMWECRLCLTVHQNDNSYLTHTMARKHQTNLARRASKEHRDGPGPAGGARIDPATGLPVAVGLAALHRARAAVLRIGRPGYKVTKLRDPVTRQVGMLFQLQYPDVAAGVLPRWQVMNAFTQRIEEPDKQFQYILVAADPYETVAFKIPARELDKSDGRQFSFWDPDAREFCIQIMFMTEREQRFNAAPGLQEF